MKYLDVMNKYKQGINRNLSKFTLYRIHEDGSISLSSNRGNIIVDYGNGFMKLWAINLEKMFMFGYPVHYFDIARVIEFKLYQTGLGYEVDSMYEGILHDINDTIPANLEIEVMKPFNIEGQ